MWTSKHIRREGIHNFETAIEQGLLNFVQSCSSRHVGRETIEKTSEISALTLAAIVSSPFLHQRR